LRCRLFNCLLFRCRQPNAGKAEWQNGMELIAALPTIVGAARKKLSEKQRARERSETKKEKNIVFRLLVS